jgi:hypothetical protein
MNHEGREGREGFHPFTMRLPTPLSPEAEEAMSETIGCAIAVHRALGPGFLESIISYLKTTRLQGGLLINFRVPVLKAGLQRVVLSS